MDSNRSHAVRVRLFGAFRDIHPSGELMMTVEQGTLVGALKTHLKEHLVGLEGMKLPESELDQLISDSVLADETRVLSDDERWTGAQPCLVVLPPVCGG